MEVELEKWVEGEPGKGTGEYFRWQRAAQKNLSERNTQDGTHRLNFHKRECARTSHVYISPQFSWPWQVVIKIKVPPIFATVSHLSCALHSAFH